MMKKTLVALATLALTGVVSAQSNVSLSGKLGFAYKTQEGAGAAPVKADGLQVTDGNFTLTASEDLGGGLKVSAMMDVQSRGRDTAISGRDASLTVAGGFGSLMIGSIELGNGIIGLGGADAPTMGLDGESGAGGITRVVLSAPVNMDVLMYTSPDMSGFTVSAAIMDTTAVSPTLGLGSAAATQDAVLLGLAYASGPINAALDFTNYGLNAVVAGAGVLDNRTRLSASYDLGVAKLGFGYESLKDTAVVNNGEKQFLIGVSAPLGAATTVGANYVRNTKDAANTVTGFELGANYALSKRTGVQVAYQSIGEDTVAGNATAFRIRLLHSF